MKLADSLRAFAALVVALAAGTAQADWTVGQLDALAQAFSSAVTPAYNAQEYPFAFLDTSHCFEAGKTCFFTNPDSPYGAPSFGGTFQFGTAMARTDALVLIMETPPAVRYFAVTPYLFTRAYALRGEIPVFESIGDSINMTDIVTTGSPLPGMNVNTQLTVLVMTGDQNTWQQVRDTFTGLGLPATAVNLMAMPVKSVPLRMGTRLTADSFSLLLRTAYPADAAALQDYIQRAPFHLFQLRASRWRPYAALPTPVSKVPGSGTVESSALASARDALVAQLTAQYGAAYTITEQKVIDVQTRNYVCIRAGLPCDGDNPDAVYSKDIHQWIPGHPDANGIPQDKLLIVGVNHVLTGKATYISHAVADDTHEAGVVAASDTWLQGSALKMAGITDPADPRYATYSQLYALTIGYDCSGEPVCLRVPQPSAGNPAGVAIGSPMDVSARTYVDPATGTRPSTAEIIGHRVFLLQKQ